LDFTGLADDLEAAWNAPSVTTRTCQRLLRTLVVDIVADVDEAARIPARRHLLAGASPGWPLEQARAHVR